MQAITSKSFRRLALAAAAAGAMLSFGTAGVAAGPSFGHVGGARMGMPSGHMGMPSHGFHGGAPQGFHGPGPRAGSSLGGPSFVGSSGGARPEHGGGREPGHFRGQSFDHFSDGDRERWSHGGWRHGWRHGHLGWWWLVDGDWFLYDQPSYPYPTYVGQDADEGEYSDDPWPYDTYYCEDPAGYYPTVQMCNVEWESVPPQ